MQRLLYALLFLFCMAAGAVAQTAITLPYAANAVADLGNGPLKARVTAGNASIFTSQGSGVGSTSGLSTTLALTSTPATPPIIGGLISGNGITSGTTVAAYNGVTSITLSAAMSVPSSTTVSWGAACPASAAGIPSQYIPASVQSDYYLLYTQARICAISPGGPVNTLLILPVFYDQTTPGGGGGGGGSPSGPAGGDLTGTYPNPTLAAILSAGGPTGSATVAPIVTYDAKGRLTAVSSATITPAIGSVTGLGTGIATALGVNVGTAGAPVINGGALGTPSSGVGTNITGIQLANITGLGTNVATALGVNVGTAGAFVVNGGALGTPSSGTGTNLTGVPISTGISGLGTGVATMLGNAVSAASGPTQTIASGSAVLGTGAIASAACASVVTVAGSGVLTTDTVTGSFNGDPTAVTGYIPSTAGGLSIFLYPTANNMNAKVCNFTSSSITPGAITLNLRVVR